MDRALAAVSDEWKATYNSFVRVRLLYYVATVASFTVAMTIGGCISGFVVVRYSDRGRNDFFSAFVGVPLAFILSCLFIDSVVQIGTDLVDIHLQPLLRFRAICVAAGLPYALVQIALLFLIELFPLCWAISSVIEEFETRVMLKAYIRGGSLSILFLAVCLVIFKIMVRMRQRWHMVSALSKEISHSDFLGIELSDISSGDDESEESEPRERNSAKERTETELQIHRSWSSLGVSDEGLDPPLSADTLKRGLVFLGLAAFMVFAIWLWLTLTGIASVGFLALIVMMLLIREAQKLLAPRLFGRIYPYMLCGYAFFTFATMAFDGGQLSLADQPWSVPNLFEPPANPGGADIDSANLGYPICSMRWGKGSEADGLQLNIFDFVAMAHSTYSTDPAEILARVGNASMNTALSDVQMQEYENYTELARYVVFNFSAAKKVVLAVRGTQQLDDILADMQMLSSVAVMGAFSNVFPIQALIPLEVIRKYMKQFNIARWFGGRPDPYEPHLQKAQSLKAQCEDEGCELFVTGHSLGGVIAAIVGAKLQVKSVAFSPPGEKFMLTSYGVTSDIMIANTSTSVLPYYDLVHKVDDQLGFRQPIDCKGKKSTAADCHIMGNTFCELLTSCGDPRGRISPVAACADWQ